MPQEKPFPELKIDHISAGYGNRTVISDLCLEVNCGETFGLIGLNGVGKTTLIKTILGLRSADEGVIEIEGRDSRDPVSKKHMAYLPERFEPPWFLSGIEFLKFSAKLYGVTHDDELIYDHARRLALEPDVLKNRVQTFSKGMRQKLGILATLLTECRLLILDEPMSGLDPKARALVKEMLGNVKEQGRTIFLSSHILADMNEICDRVAVLHSGRFVFTGTPAALSKEGVNDNLERAFLNIIEKQM